MAKKINMKYNKKHNGKEFKSSFRFIGKVSPVQRKDETTDSWFDLPIFDTTTTTTNKPRNVLQFQVETAPFNKLKVELAGMEMPQAFAYSRTDQATHRMDWEERFDKEKYPNDTYHLIETDWDKSARLGELVEDGMWVDVKGHYEFDTFESADGNEIKLTKRIIEYINPLRNGLLEITGMKQGEQVKVYDALEEGNYLGTGKVDKDGKLSAHIGWLNPQGGSIYICKVENDEELERKEIKYTEGTETTGAVTVTNGLEESSVRFNKPQGGFEYRDYYMDFNHEEFEEVNEFDMQLGIRSTYFDQDQQLTLVNGVFLDYGKEKSTPKHNEFVVYHKEVEDGKKSLAQAFEALNETDFLEVTGIDNNRVMTQMVEVVETESDNPFDDVSSEDKEANFERVSAGTKRGLEITGYKTGTLERNFLTQEELGNVTEADDSPFADVGDDDLPF